MDQEGVLMLWPPWICLGIVLELGLSLLQDGNGVDRVDGVVA